MTTDRDFFCESCQVGKSHRLQFGKQNEARVVKPGERIHSVVYGPMSVESLGSARFYVIFKDEATDYCHVFFIRHKSDVCDQFETYINIVSNKFGRTIKYPSL